MRTITPLVRRALVAGPLASVLLAGGVAATSEPPTSEPASAASDEFCDAAWQIRDAAMAIDGFTEESDPGSVQRGYEDLAAATSAARDSAPPELADGLDLLAGQAGVALAVVEANGFDLTTTYADPRWEALFEFERDAGLSEDDSAVEAYVEANCDEPIASSEEPDADAICEALADFAAATDVIGEVLADETSGPAELQQSFTDYNAEIDRLIESGPAELSDYLGEWRGVMESFEDLLEQNDWNLVDTLTDPQNLEIQEDISALGNDSPTLGVEAARCDRSTDSTSPTSETTIG